MLSSKYQNQVAKLIRSIKREFLEINYCYNQQIENDSEEEANGMIGNSQNSDATKKWKIVLALIILVDAFFSKTVAYYFLHVKAGIPFDYFGNMWILDFILGFLLAFVIVKVSLLLVEMGLRKFREVHNQNRFPHHIFGYLLMFVIPLVNIAYKFPDDSFNWILNGLLPLLVFVCSCLFVYLYADAAIKSDTNQRSRWAKDKINRDIASLTLFVADLKPDEIGKLLDVFGNIEERYILNRHFHGHVQSTIASDGGGLNANLSANGFVKYYDSIK